MIIVRKVKVANIEFGGEEGSKKFQTQLVLYWQQYVVVLCCVISD